MPLEAGLGQCRAPEGELGTNVPLGAGLTCSGPLDPGLSYMACSCGFVMLFFALIERRGQIR